MRTGWPDVKWSMMAARTIGFSTSHSRSGDLVTVTKSLPRNTPTIPSSSNSRSASGERAACSTSVKLAVPSPMTSRPGQEFQCRRIGGDLRLNKHSVASFTAEDAGEPIVSVLRHPSLIWSGRTRRSSRRRRGCQKAHRVVDFSHDRPSDRARPGRPLGENLIDAARIALQPPHLFGDRPQLGDREIGQVPLEGGKQGAGKPFTRPLQGFVGQRGIDAQQIGRFRAAL